MATVEMVLYCFDKLYNSLQVENNDTTTEQTSLIIEDSESLYPMFVTWKVLGTNGNDPQLRGCIGTLKPTALSNMGHYVLQSALKDSRFDPIQLHELPTLQCTVSLLTHYEDAEHYADWTVGTHGIMINFTDAEQKKYNATYLPEVALEQQWSQVQTVTSLIKKAGYNKKVTKEVLQIVKVTRYQSSKKTLAWSEYLKYKK